MQLENKNTMKQYTRTLVQKIGILTGSFFMLSGVILGAFGAHGLSKVLSEYHLAIFKTGVLYQFIHALGILVVMFYTQIFPLSKQSWLSALFFSIGIVFFSGSLYALAMQGYLKVDLKFLGPITPIGGLFFILGWLWFMKEIFFQKKE